MNLDTLLLRQINPAFIINERVASIAFCPTPKDEKQLSDFDNEAPNNNISIFALPCFIVPPPTAVAASALKDTTIRNQEYIL
jgi:hypothetical protein